MRGFVALQSELSSDAIMGRRFFFWTGNIREVLVTLVWLLQYCKDQAGLQIGSQ